MNKHIDKTQENKSQAVANNVTQLQTNVQSAVPFADSKPESAAQQNLQEGINHSPRVQQLKAYQEMANNSLPVKQLRDYQSTADNFSLQTAQRKENLKEEPLQGKFEPIQKKENNTGLPDNLKSGIENLSGHSMDDVKVHYNSDKPSQLQAHAYAQGTEIHIASGQEKHLPHEAWHVVQQKQDRVKPTIQMKGGVNVNDDAGLEKEADLMGAKALQMKSSSSPNAPIPSSQSHVIVADKVVQRIPDALTIPGKQNNEHYLGWGSYRVAKEVISKPFGLVRGLESMIGGLGRKAGIDLPGTYPNANTASLSAELQAALPLAIANNNAIPGWLAVGQRRPNAGIYAPGAAAAGQPQYGNPHRATYLAKFGSTFFNDDGSLPGVRGAGGYKEYYAEPSAGACVGVWGSNRILKQTNDPTGTYYWATSNHYKTFTYIKDA